MPAITVYDLACLVLEHITYGRGHDHVHVCLPAPAGDHHTGHVTGLSWEDDADAFIVLHAQPDTDTDVGAGRAATATDPATDRLPRHIARCCLKLLTPYTHQPPDRPAP